MANSDITFNVGINVDEDTASKALTVLEWFLSDNPEMIIVQNKQPDGKVVLQIGYPPDNGTCPYCGQSIGQKVIKGFAIEHPEVTEIDSNESSSDDYNEDDSSDLFKPPHLGD